jgi:SPP1 family predicted phage head-tail adaptor
MPAGKRDRRVTFLIKSEGATDGFGTPAVIWSPGDTVWAEKLNVSDSERVKAMAAGVVMTIRFNILSTQAARALTSADRIQFEGDVFELVAKPKEIGRRKELELTAALVDEAKA